MATIGLKDLYFAKATVNETTGVVTYETPVKLAKAISAELSVEAAEGTLYGDDSVDETVKEFVSGELTLGVTDITDENIGVLLGKSVDGNGVLISSTNDEAPYVAIGFRAKKPRGKFKYVWLYLVKFTIPNENYQTKGDSIEFTTPEIVGVFVADVNGKWKADKVLLPTDAVALAWFTEVYTPVAVTTPTTPAVGE